MEKIRVTPKMVTIEVSDNGETIKFCADELLMDGLVEIVSLVNESKKNAPSMIEDESSLKDSANYLKRIAADVADKIDELFGPETCRKVFHGNVPTLQAEVEFFTQITPIVRKFIREENERVSRHTEKYVRR
ncbi:hypothetical protein [Clostridium phoceensis]|uniref:hypothetical protein n=1 Tax=Clostridium phoceensis TaxID=1650661 RepID=UPI0026DC4473|nr:hypothetical protein [Clostridium phoceensis]